MAANFVPMFTRAGLAALRNAQGSGLQAAISHIAVGRGQLAANGGRVGYNPDGSETALRSEIVRAPLLYATPFGDPGSSDPIGFRVVSEIPALPAGSSSVPVMEVGFLLDTGVLLCVWSTATDGSDVIGSLTVNNNFDLALDLYLTAVPASALTITVISEGPPDNLACLAQLLRVAAINFSNDARARFRAAQLGIRG